MVSNPLILILGPHIVYAEHPFILGTAEKMIQQESWHTRLSALEEATKQGFINYLPPPSGGGNNTHATYLENNAQLLLWAAQQYYGMDQKNR